MEHRSSLEPTAETTTERLAGLPVSRLQAWAGLAPRVAAAGIPTQREVRVA
ncbi:hypothetical protein [Cellulomonas endophytica]|uniref:hypothetical protein n=1 Tax=Cellulomonas endophytica TaxID=2494735 RepID=UPI0013E8F5B2|nr:hypothetical protein [Cellulomonas endophytica]